MCLCVCVCGCVCVCACVSSFNLGLLFPLACAHVRSCMQRPVYACANVRATQGGKWGRGAGFGGVSHLRRWPGRRRWACGPEGCLSRRPAALQPVPAAAVVATGIGTACRPASGRRQRCRPTCARGRCPCPARAGGGHHGTRRAVDRYVRDHGTRRRARGARTGRVTRATWCSRWPSRIDLSCWICGASPCVTW